MAAISIWSKAPSAPLSGSRSPTARWNCRASATSGRGRKARPFPRYSGTMPTGSRCDYREIAPSRRRTARNDIGLTALDLPVRTCFPRPCKAGRERVAKALFRDRPDLTRTHPGPLRPKCTSENAPVAQLDRAPDYESGGQEFESLRARQYLAEVQPDVSLLGGPNCADMKVYRVRGCARRSRAGALENAIIFA